MSLKNRAIAATAMAGALVFVAVAAAIPSRPAHAGEGGAFVGGLIGGHILTNMANQSERRTRAAEQQAYQRQQAPAQKSEPTVEERLATLDKLAANGIITKEEYEGRRKAIIDGI